MEERCPEHGHVLMILLLNLHPRSLFYAYCFFFRNNSLLSINNLVVHAFLHDHIYNFILFSMVVIQWAPWRDDFASDRGKRFTCNRSRSSFCLTMEVVECGLWNENVIARLLRNSGSCEIVFKNFIFEWRTHVIFLNIRSILSELSIIHFD